MASSNHIASVYFEYPLVIISDVPPLRGRVRKCLGGELVVVTVPRTEAEHDAMTLRVSFEWVPFATVRQLQSWWQYGRQVSFRADYVHGYAIIDPEEGVYDVEHIFGDDQPIYQYKDTESDYCNGKVCLQVLRGYRSS